jgi:predicted PurR-regulated permease PerM|tara:strand:+ start:49 stop:231 length:183 start_codon:yes stop_codon:yes gene_type:complete
MSAADRYWERLEKKIDKFLFNDFRHMAEDVASLKAQMRIVFSLLLIILAAAVGILGREIL